MSDSFRQVTSTSWFGRIGRSIGGAVVGLILIVAMVALLFWNEGRAVQTAKSLAEGAHAVVSADAGAVEAANEGKLVHVSGTVTTAETPSDPHFGISAKGVRLERHVQMYQWRQQQKSETTKKLGGGEETVTTYSYSRNWEDHPIDSSDFKQPGGHINPEMTVRDGAFQVSAARLGAFDLDDPVLRLIGGEKTLPVDSSQLAAIRGAYSGTHPVSIADGRIFLGADPALPQVGDYRIGYEIVPAGDISVIGQQQGSRFQPYQTVAGDKLLMVDVGIVPAERMFSDAASANTLITWIIRAVGLVVLFIAFALLLAPFGTVADVIPFLGGMVGFGTGVIAFILAVLLGSATIALAWLWYRPLLAVLIAAAGVAIVLLAGSLGRRRRAVVAGPAAAPSPMSAPPAPSVPSPPPTPSGGSSAKPGKIAW